MSAVNFDFWHNYYVQESGQPIFCPFSSSASTQQCSINEGPQPEASSGSVAGDNHKDQSESTTNAESTQNLKQDSEFALAEPQDDEAI